MINFQEIFKKTALECSVVDKDGNNSTLNNVGRRLQAGGEMDLKTGETSFRAGDRSGLFVLQELGQDKGTYSFNGRPLLKNVYAKRQEEK